MKKAFPGFTLVEVLVVIAIISILSGVIYASFGDARENSRDKVRKTELKELALAIELYKSQFGFYPAEGRCGGPLIGPNDTPLTANWDGQAAWTGPGPHSASWGNACNEYILGLAPDFIDTLSTDPNQENEDNVGFMYRVSPMGDRYKLLILDTVESDTITSFENEFVRCPSAIAGSPCQLGAPANTYAVYSTGAEAW